MGTRSRLGLLRAVVAGPERPTWQCALFALGWFALFVLILVSGWSQEAGPLCAEPCSTASTGSPFPRPR